MAAKDRWPLNRGDHISRFDCIWRHIQGRLRWKYLFPFHSGNFLWNDFALYRKQILSLKVVPFGKRIYSNAILLKLSAFSSKTWIYIQELKTS